MDPSPGKSGARNGISPQALRAAIEDRRMDLYYQPIASLSDRSATMLEALPRWPNPEHGILAPADFISVAESNGLIGPLEIWAIREAVNQLSRWNSGVASELTISLNLSEKHVYESDLPGVVENAASACGIDRRRLGCEISEAALLDADGRSIGKLRAMAEIGVALTVDDYSGAAPPEMLRELPVSALKISRRLVAGIPDDERCVESVVGAIATARDLKVTVIANGVESPGQLASLRDLGCGYAQGFLISLPMPADALEERMT
jgi:EAL domain-containing protein (putative c-di-GMP-specific phosphodiesterase class I)